MRSAGLLYRPTTARPEHEMPSSEGWIEIAYTSACFSVTISGKLSGDIKQSKPIEQAPSPTSSISALCSTRAIRCPGGFSRPPAPYIPQGKSRRVYVLIESNSIHLLIYRAAGLYSSPSKVAAGILLAVAWTRGAIVGARDISVQVVYA